MRTKTESSAAAETETAAVKSEASDTEQAQESQEPSASGDPIRIGLTTVLTGIVRWKESMPPMRQKS